MQLRTAYFPHVSMLVAAALKVFVSMSSLLRLRFPLSSRSQKQQSADTRTTASIDGTARQENKVKLLEKSTIRSCRLRLLSRQKAEMLG